jgi:hypothetical protein
VALNKKALAVSQDFAYFKRMKIEFDKAALWLIPYLYLVSVLYYWGYWGTIGIDVFNYYPVTDLIKGITAPLRTSLLLSLVAGIYFIMIKFIVERIKYKNIIPRFWLAGFIILLLNPTKDYIGKLVHTAYERLVFNTEIINTSFIFFSVLSAYYINKGSNNKNRILEQIKFSLTCAALLLPVQSFCDARKLALATQFNQRFLYNTTAYITKKAVIYKYLGKTGDYQVFETLNNYKKIIVPVGDLKPFVFEEYSMSNKESLNRFRANARRANALNGQAN